MEHIFWLVEGEIAGRSGPNTDIWNLSEFKSAGFSAILSVNNGEAVHQTMLDALGIAYANIPMSPNAPPQPGDKEFCLENLPRAVEFVKENVTSGPVLIHCRAGKDRTGMVMAAYLIAGDGCDVTEAMNKVIQVRPIAFTAEGWMEYGFEVLKQYKTGLV